MYADHDGARLDDIQDEEKSILRSQLARLDTVSDDGIGDADAIDDADGIDDDEDAVETVPKQVETKDTVAPSNSRPN
jgi:hypothetical protein